MIPLDFGSPRARGSRFRADRVAGSQCNYGCCHDRDRQSVSCGDGDQLLEGRFSGIATQPNQDALGKVEDSPAFVRAWSDDTHLT